MGDRYIWTHHTPEFEGWYWWRPTPDEEADLVYVFFSRLTKSWWAGARAYWKTSHHALDTWGGEWAGPILKPEDK